MSSGILFLCATPIGNLEDITFRAIKILREVDLIAAEDTRHTRKLLSHFDIHKPLIRFDENCKMSVTPKILQQLKIGSNIALVSDAGTPTISDPGADLVRSAIDAKIKVSPIPGANAALCALICSGFDTRKFLFIGFPPKTQKKRRELLKELSTDKATLIFYETPHRITFFLSELLEFFGNRRALLARELTKVHEEFIHGNLEELLKCVNEPRGEFVVVIEGNNTPQTTPKDFLLFYKFLIEQGLDKRAAMREIAQKFKISRREVYNSVIKN